MIDFSRKPTKNEWKQYRKWVKYLSDSKLSKEEVHKRAASFVSQKTRFPK